MKKKAERAPQHSEALDSQLCFALYTASTRMIRLFGPHLKPLGLTYPQYLVMLVLWEDSPRSVGDLCQLLGLDFGALSPLLKRMEARGFIQRRRSQEDERRVDVMLTEEGRLLRQKTSCIPDQMVCKMALPMEALEELHGAVRTFNHQLATIPETRRGGQ